MILKRNPFRARKEDDKSRKYWTENAPFGPFIDAPFKGRAITVNLHIFSDSDFKKKTFSSIEGRQ